MHVDTCLFLLCVAAVGINFSNCVLPCDRDLIKMVVLKFPHSVLIFITLRKSEIICDEIKY